MRFIRNIKLLTSIRIYISLLFTAIFIVSGILFYIEGRNFINNLNESDIGMQLDELEHIIEMQLNRDNEILEMAKNVADHKINEYSDIIESTDKENAIKAVDPFTKKTIEISLNEWYVDGLPLLNNYLLVDQISNLTKLDVSIYQKSDKGYVNSSTSIKSIDEERMKGDMILKSSPIIEAIEQGNEYSGRVYQNNAWYLTICKPIFIDGEVKGLYYLGIKERLGRALRKIFSERKHLKSGFPFVITKEGVMLIHPNRQGKNFSDTELYNKIVEQESSAGNISYKWPNNNEGQLWNLHYKFHNETNSFICLTYPRSEKYKPLLKYSIFGIASFVIFIFFFQIIYTSANRPLKRMFRRLQNTLNQLAKGQEATKFEISKHNEFYELAEKVNIIASRFNDLAGFASGLANNDFAQVYPKTLIDDNIGEALIKINDKLNDAMYNENIRQKEEKLRAWESEGLSKFVNILQRNRENLDELCYDLISNLVEYLNADLGALFFINSDNPEDIYFEQMATYAFEQKKKQLKKIYPEQGLIGRIYNEKETIFLSEIPQDYIKIASGLGKGSPKNLLIVPLLINKEVYGAIEIASFNLIKGFHIEFIEKIAENIASTINNVLVNNKTKELLKQSREQSELLSNQEEEMRKNLMELKQIQAKSDESKFESREKLKQLEHNLLILEINHKGVILFVNDVIPDFFAMKKENLLKKQYSDYSSYVPVDEYKNLISSWEKLKSGVEVQTDLKVKNGFGVMTKVLVNMTPIMKDEQLDKVLLLGIELKIQA